jgi:trehalose 6-phosphate phosphatase
VFVDFDGTLAPIVDDPDAARPIEGAPAVLADLAGRYGRVAVISGRPVSFLLAHFGRPAHLGDPAPGVVLIGLYGLERAVGGEVRQSPGAAQWRPVVDAAATSAEAAAPAGVRVERKGLTVTLHYRGADEQAGWTATFATELAAASGLVGHPGKKSWELRPPVPTDKGTVVEELAAGLDAVCYAGDDMGDVPAFAALARLRAAGVATLAVAAGGTETPAQLIEAADLVVEGPAGVLQLLQGLAAETGPRHRPLTPAPDTGP